MDERKRGLRKLLPGRHPAVAKGAEEREATGLSVEAPPPRSRLRTQEGDGREPDAVSPPPGAACPPLPDGPRDFPQKGPGGDQPAEHVRRKTYLLRRKVTLKVSGVRGAPTPHGLTFAAPKQRLESSFLILTDLLRTSREVLGMRPPSGLPTLPRSEAPTRPGRLPPPRRPGPGANPQHVSQLEQAQH
ncbi:uncharacterized protein LOC109497680 isoform X3 [Felis catus]|nr:uncharacterized protein LOC109497680 isoform X3 [Felis catus]